MRPLLAKALDRAAIWMAARSVTADESSSNTQASLAEFLIRPHPFREISGTTPDIKLLSDGHFEFASPIRTAWVENNRVAGVLTQPPQTRRKPRSVILVHGWNAEYCYRHIFPRLASAMTAQGLTTAMFQLPYHGKRRPRGPGTVQNFISTDLGSMLQATEQAVHEIVAIAEWLSDRGTDVGVWGFSLGAWLSGLAMSASPRLDFGILTTPIVQLDRTIENLPFCEPIRRCLREAANTEELFRRLDLRSNTPQAGSQNVLLMEALHDLFVPPDTVESLFRSWHGSEIWRLEHGHIGVLMSRAVWDRAIAWLSNRA